MLDIFNTDKKIHQRFDLKGSTKGRTFGGDLAEAKPGACALFIFAYASVSTFCVVKKSNCVLFFLQVSWYLNAHE